MYSTMKEKSSQHLVSTQFDFILTFVLIVVSFAHVRNLEAEWKWLTSWAAITGNGPEILKKETETNTIFHVYMHSKQKHSHPENQYEAQRLFTNLKFYYSNFYFQALQPNAYSLTAICISTAENEKLGLRRPSWITPSSEKLHAQCVCAEFFDKDIRHKCTTLATTIFVTLLYSTKGPFSQKLGTLVNKKTAATWSDDITTDRWRRAHRTRSALKVRGHLL